MVELKELTGDSWGQSLQGHRALHSIWSLCQGGLTFLWPLMPCSGLHKPMARVPLSHLMAKAIHEVSWESLCR